ncbi:MAG: ribosome maturation factor RimM [Bdellovibrionales bacterium]
MSFRHIGKVKDPHGLKGELYILVFSKDVSWLSRLQELQLRRSTEAPQTYKILTKRAHKDGFLVRVTGIEDRNASEAVKGCEVWIPEELLVSRKGETIFLREILGFAVFLKDRCVGHVESFSSNGPQDLLVIRNEEHVFEVPFVEAFIVNLDFSNRRLEMDFPEGLIKLEDE